MCLFSILMDCELAPQNLSVQFSSLCGLNQGVTEVKKIWGKVFDLIPLPPVDLTNEENAIEGPEEPQVVEKN